MYLNEESYTGTVCSELSKIADYTLENFSQKPLGVKMITLN
jgi:hypothetical protein